MLKWPPPYTIRFSKRAKYLKLHIDERDGLLLVLPQSVSKKAALRFLNSKRSWVEKHADLLTPKPVIPVTIKLPEIIKLDLLQRCWQVQYEPLSQITSKPRILQRGDRLIVKHQNDQGRVVLLLKAWLKRLAKQHLTELIRQVSAETGLRYNRLSFRHQKTLWASCSFRANISLNIKLLFMSLKYTRYVMIHELCHTVHMNHSRQFWHLVSQHEPHYLQLDKEINNVQNTVPSWYDASGLVIADSLPQQERECHT
ncbi:MAG: M48 family metallopeptidase [Gammaproteobacteria bacterium]|nr:M48 family metallopeptidase [Gammaproteobacteria bacterium]MCH9743389.1 M48 family metallopeptidase [Gammaproteobacteria bacterium]